MLLITSIIEKEDRSGNEYRIVQFIEEETLKEVKRSFWKDSYPIVFTYSEGDRVEGLVITEKVVRYQIGPLIRDTYTTVILGKFPTTSMLKLEIEKSFRKLGMKLLQDNTTERMARSLVVNI